jgi:hypothetical protein
MKMNITPPIFNTPINFNVGLEQKTLHHNIHTPPKEYIISQDPHPPLMLNGPLREYITYYLP